MEWIDEIKKLKDGECYIIPQSDYGKAEVWLKNNVYFLFEIPFFGGEPVYSKHYYRYQLSLLVQDVESWT